jgi:hypothetical protein
VRREGKSDLNARDPDKHKQRKLIQLQISERKYYTENASKIEQNKYQDKNKKKK